MVIVPLSLLRTRTKIFFSLLVVVFGGFYYLTSRVLEDLKPQYRQASEESLVDTAEILAALVSTKSQPNNLSFEALEHSLRGAQQSHPTARIYGYRKERVDLRVYATDAQGIVQYDSLGKAVGLDFSRWNDVHRTLHGEYGARTTRDNPDDPQSAFLYVAAPIKSGTEILGVLTVGKPVTNLYYFHSRKQSELLWLAFVAAAVSLLPAFAFAWLLSRPLETLTRYAREVRDGKRNSIPSTGDAEVAELAQAFEEMRRALEGKQYIEQYVQSLTHELKSPLSAIRGAAELLEPDLPPKDRAAFLRNIQLETRRMQEIIDRLLELAVVESQKAIKPEEINAGDLVRELKEGFALQAEKHGVRFSCTPNESTFYGERFLIFRALSNLLHNALDFTPVGGSVSFEASKEGDFTVFTVRDTGTGIPGYALPRIFERFYSLPRPDSQRKSSGLGLPFVRQVALLHGGEVLVRNNETGGVLATFTIRSS